MERINNMANVVYIIEKTNGEKFKVTVPDTWKVTFGPAVVGNRVKPGPQYAGKMPMALRFYENETKQRAIFTDIASFRDMSIPIEVEKVKVQEKDGYMECDGVRKRTTFQAKVKDWINPDDERPSHPLLPEDTEMFGEE